MRISKGDYCVARQDQGKDYLFKALSDISGKTVEAVLEKDCHIPELRHTMTVAVEDVVVNLGQKPYAGKVYGFNVGSVFSGRKEHPAFGTINFFYKPDKQIVKDLWASMDQVAKRLDRLGLLFLLDDVTWEILPYSKEKYAGMCIIKKSKEENAPGKTRIQIRPEIMPSTEYPYVWYHEIGHHLHGNYVTGKKINAQWLRLFNTSIRVATVKKETSSSLLEQLMEQEDPPSAFKGQLDEDDALAFKWIIRTIGQVNALNIKDLDTLFEADMKDDIRKLWPTRTIPRKELAPIISEYATVNFRETFAESFAFYMTKKKLPDPIVKLVEKSISYGKAKSGGSNE